MNFTDKSPHGQQLLGIGDDVRRKLAELSGTVPVLHWMPTDAKESWREADNVEALRVRKRPAMFITSTWSAPDPQAPEDPAKRWHLASGVWLDIDAKTDHGQTIEDAVTALKETAVMLHALGIPLGCCSLFASGGKGFHVFIPLELLVPGGVQACGIPTARLFPRICWRFVLDTLVTRLTDTGIYNGGRGRVFRQEGVKRDNGAFKVPLTWVEGLALDAHSYREACIEPRVPVLVEPVQGLAVRAAMAWEAACAVVLGAKPSKTQKAALGRGGNLLTAERVKVVEALRMLAGKLDYSEWVLVGSALKSTGATDAFDLWDWFSKPHPKYSRDECVAKWETFNGAPSLGSIFWLANKVKNGSRK